MDILQELNLAGLSVSLEGDRVKVENPGRLTNGLRDLIRSHKPDIVSRLSKARAAQNSEMQQAIREQVEERAAIKEYDGGLPRAEAERQADSAARAYCYRLTDKPNSELWVIMSGTNLVEAKASLERRFGIRLVAVYEPPAYLARAVLH
jgi:hypothetical protein